MQAIARPLHAGLQEVLWSSRSSLLAAQEFSGDRWNCAGTRAKSQCASAEEHSSVELTDRAAPKLHAMCCCGFRTRKTIPIFTQRHLLIEQDRIFKMRHFRSRQSSSQSKTIDLLS